MRYTFSAQDSPEAQAKYASKFAHLLEAAGKEHNKLLKLNTIRLCNLLNMDIDNIYKSEIVKSVAELAAQHSTEYKGKEFTIDDAHKIGSILRDAKKQVVKNMRSEWASACHISGKPLYGVIQFQGDISDRSEINGNLKEGSKIKFQGICMDYSRFCTNAVKCTVDQSVLCSTELYNQYGTNYWLIETDDAIYTNDANLAAEYYELKQSEHLQQQTKDTNQEMIDFAKEFLKDFNFPTPYDEWETFEEYPPVHAKPNGSLESPEEARQRWFRDREVYFDKCEQEAEKLVRACIEHRIPILVVPDTMMLQRDINVADITLYSDRWGSGHFCQQEPKVGETVYAMNTATCELDSNGAFGEQEYETLKATVYGSISGPTQGGDDRILLTDAGVMMSSWWQRELLLVRKEIEKEMFVDQDHSERK